MKTEYRIVFTMTFSSQATRDAAYTKIKNLIVAQSGQLTGYIRADMTPDEYQVPDIPTTSEKIL